MKYEQNDRLSSLPREILIIILSFLPTNVAVTTAILSSSWRHLWTNITALRFNITDLPEHKLKAIFFIILRRVSWPRINAIELTINVPTTLARVAHDFIYTGKNVKELKVNFKNSGTSSLISIPSFFLKKQSLEVLEMYADHGLSLGRVDVNDKHPNLRKLVISVREYDLKSFENLLKSSPLLEILRVHVQVLNQLKGPIKINAQNLKHLSMNLVCEKHILDKNKYMLDTPKLQYFEVHSPCILKFCFLKTPTGLLKAKLFMGDGRPFFSKHALSVFNPIFRVKTLKISGDLLLALDSPGFKIEVFHKLSHLEMDLNYIQLGWSGVKCFLQQCPNVECLVLRRTCRANWDGLNWPEIQFLPRSLHNKIERIELWNFGDCEIVLQAVRYIFSVAKALKKLHITIQINGESANRKEIQLSPEFLALSEELPSCEITILLYKDGQNI